jgi:Tfp pilus assembly protein PilF
MSDRTPTKPTADEEDDFEDEDEFEPSPGLNVRRIAIAGGIAVAILLAGGAYFGVQAYRTSARVAEKRSAGLELVARNATTQSQREAIGLLNATVSRNPEDAEAMIAYATASLRVPRPDGEHLLDASKAWSNVVSRSPAGHDDVRRKLVLLYDQLGQTSRVVDVIESLRKRRPDDAEIARVHAIALLRLGRNNEAVEAATAWAQLAPESFDAQSLRVQVMRSANATDREVDAYIESQLRARPASPAIQLLKVQSLFQTGRAEPALKLFQAVLSRADQISPASDVAVPLVVMLDRLGQRRPATGFLLDLVSRADADPQLRDKASTRELHLLLALRAWDAGEHALASRLFNATEPIELKIAAQSSTQPATQPATTATAEPSPAAPRGDPVLRKIAPFPDVPPGLDSEKAIESPEAYATLTSTARWNAYAALHALMMNEPAEQAAALARLDRLPLEFAEPWQSALAIIRGDTTVGAVVTPASPAKGGDASAAAGAGPAAGASSAADPASTEEERIRRLHGRLDRVLARGAGDPLILAALADLRLRLSRPDEADRALLAGTQMPAGWSIASQKLVQLRRSRGQSALALDVARQAYRRSEASIEQSIRLAQVLSDISPRDEDQQKQFDEVVRGIQRAVPLEANTLPMYVGLLAVQGKPDEAKQVVESALASDRVSPRTLVDLAGVSYAHKLGLEQKCQERAAQLRGGDSPDVVLGWARLEHAAGRTEAALKRLDERLAAAPAEEKRAWQEVRATFLAQVGAADAGKAWAELADANPGDLDLQRRLLALQGAADAEAQRRAIERLKKALPDDPSWRIASARLALSPGAVPPDAAGLKQISADMNAIVERRPEQLDARLLLVECLRRSGNQLAAVQQLERADEASPGQPSIVLLTAQLVFEQGDRDRAADLLARLAKINVPLTPQQRFVAAQLYARLDRTDAAIEQLQASRGASREGDRLLANLLHRVGRTDEARALLDTMLLDPDAETLLLGAGIAESRGDTAEVTRLLDRLAALPVPESQKLLLLARYHLNWGRRDVAESLLARAVTGSTGATSTSASASLTINPSAPVEAQLLLAQLRIEQGRAEDGVAVLRAGAKALPHEVQLVDAASQADRILAASRAGAPTLAVALLSDPFNRGSQSLADFLARPAPASAAEAASATTLRAEFAEVDRMAESYVDSYVVQLYCADQFLQRGQPLRAASIAGRLVARNPSDPTPARLAATAFARAGEWRQCASAIEGWRAKLPKGSTEPDPLDAISLARQGRHDEVLAKYLARAKASPKTQAFELLSGVALSLHATRRDADAVELVWSAISDEPRKIAFWLDFAASRVDPPAAAAAWCDRVESGLSTQSTSALLRAAIVDTRDRIADRAAANDPALASTLRDIAEREATRIEAMSDAPAAALNALTQRRLRRAAQLASSGSAEQARAERALAEQVFRAWSARTPDDWVVKNNYANLLLDERRFEEAAPLVDAALKLAPTEPAVIDTHATLLLRKRDFAVARAEARRAVELQPRNPQWRLTLAEATWALDDKPATLAELEVLRWQYREREFWPADQVERYVKLDKSVNPPPPPATRRATSRPTSRPTTSPTSKP